MGQPHWPPAAGADGLGAGSSSDSLSALAAGWLAGGIEAVGWNGGGSSSHSLGAGRGGGSGQAADTDAAGAGGAARCSAVADPTESAALTR